MAADLDPTDLKCRVFLSTETQDQTVESPSGSACSSSTGSSLPSTGSSAYSSKENSPHKTDVENDNTALDLDGCANAIVSSLSSGFAHRPRFTEDPCLVEIEILRGRHKFGPVLEGRLPALHVSMFRKACLPGFTPDSDVDNLFTNIQRMLTDELLRVNTEKQVSDVELTNARTFLDRTINFYRDEIAAENIIWPNVSLESMKLGGMDYKVLCHQFPNHFSTSEWTVQFGKLTSELKHKLSGLIADQHEVEDQFFHLESLADHIASVPSIVFDTMKAQFCVMKRHQLHLIDVIKNCRATKLAFPGRPAARLVVLFVENYFRKPASGFPTQNIEQWTAFICGKLRFFIPPV